jgi:hypothetical protein
MPSLTRHLRQVTRDDHAAHYSYILGFLHRSNLLELTGPAAANVTPEKVEAYIDELKDWRGGGRGGPIFHVNFAMQPRRRSAVLHYDSWPVGRALPGKDINVSVRAMAGSLTCFQSPPCSCRYPVKSY